MRVGTLLALSTLLLLHACKESAEHQPVPIAGKDTVFSIPPQFAGKDVSCRFADVDGDGFRDVLLLARQRIPIKGAGEDSLLVYRFNPARATHEKAATYADFGIDSISLLHWNRRATPLIIVHLNGGGNDATTFGKVVLAWNAGTLRTLASVPWGDPELIELDSSLVMEVHQTFSGVLPHAMALEYADSLVVVATSAAPRSYRSLLEQRSEQLRSELDSLWQCRAQLRSDQWSTVASKIMSRVNLASKTLGTARARTLLAAELRRWKGVLPATYHDMLADFGEQLGAEEFSFIR